MPPIVVITADEQKILDAIKGSKTDNANWGLYQLIDLAGLTRPLGSAAVAGLVDLGYLGTSLSGRGQTTYCKCGDLLTKD